MLNAVSVIVGLGALCLRQFMPQATMHTSIFAGETPRFSSPKTSTSPPLLCCIFIFGLDLRHIHRQFVNMLVLLTSTEDVRISMGPWERPPHVQKTRKCPLRSRYSNTYLAPPFAGHLSTHIQDSQVIYQINRVDAKDCSLDMAQ